MCRVRPSFRPTSVHTGTRGGPAVAALAALLPVHVFTVLSLACARAGANGLVARVENEGAGYRVTAEGALPVDRSIAWAVLTDYNRFGEFLPGVRSSRVIRSQGRLRWVSQQGVARLLLFSLPLDLVVQVEEDPQTALRIEMVSGNVEAMRGEWRLETAPSARADGATSASAQVRLVHSGYCGLPSMTIPVPRVIVRAVLVRQVQRALDGYVAEMLRRAAVVPADTAWTTDARVNR